MPSRKSTFTAEIARSRISEKLRKAGVKGVLGFVTAKTPSGQRTLYERALGEMMASGSVARISAGAKPRYFASEFAPSAECAAVKMEQYAALKHPVLLAQTAFRKALAAVEKPLLAEALQLLLSQVRLLKLNSGRAYVYAHTESVRKMLGSATADGKSANVESHPPPAGPGATRVVEPRRIRDAYLSLVKRTGFPDVEIAALLRESGVELAGLKKWLLDEHGRGRVDFYLGDWSLATDRERAAAVELRDQQYLLVRLEN